MPIMAKRSMTYTSILRLVRLFTINTNIPKFPLKPPPNKQHIPISPIFVNETL